jgi:hypothetical protein
MPDRKLHVGTGKELKFRRHAVVHDSHLILSPPFMKLRGEIVESFPVHGSRRHESFQLGGEVAVDETLQCCSELWPLVQETTDVVERPAHVAAGLGEVASTGDGSPVKARAVPITRPGLDASSC